MDPQSEQPGIDVNEIIKGSREDRLLHQLSEEIRRIAQLHDYGNPDRDKRWQYLIDGVGTLEDTIDFSIHSGKDHISAGIDTPLFVAREEGARLKGLPPNAMIGELAKRIDAKIAHYKTEAEDPNVSPIRRQNGRHYTAVWELRQAGFMFGLRSLGLNLDSRESVIPGGTRISSPNQIDEAVGKLRNDLQDMPQLPPPLPTKGN
jgi:hypothetical protein